MRGSASVEMLLILIVAVYMAAIVYKEVIVAGFQFAGDEYKVAMARLAADNISNTAQFLKASAPGTMKKVEITIPENVKLSCDQDQDYIKIEVDTNRTYDACNNTSKCSGQVPLGLECNVNWNIEGPINRKIVALVKIGGDQIKIGDPV